MNYQDFKKKINNKLIIFLIFYLTILIGFYFDEDALGGANHDFLLHYRIVERFNIDFFETFKNFGNREMDLGTRNSPIFWIILSFFNKLISIDIIRAINTIVSLLIGFSLFKCLKLKFKNQSEISLILLTSIIFLSPTVRALSIWPYNQIWGLLFFILSIFYFLKFKESLNIKNKIRLSLKFLFFLILSSYIHPSFAIFIIYYSFHLFYEFKVSKYLIYLILYCLVLSIPFFLYVNSMNILEIFYKAEGIDVDVTQSLNISNKIIIIFTMLLFFILPLINLRKIFFEIKSIKLVPLLITLFIGFICIYFFNFPYFDGGSFGGGFFHKLSNILFKNNFLLYFIFIISLIIIYLILFKEKKLNNLILLIMLILSNPQFTIYNKYFDPLIFIIFLTLFEFDIKKHFFEKKYRYFQLYFISISYFIMALLKPYVL